jgi:HK97 family phage portal protein
VFGWVDRFVARWSRRSLLSISDPATAELFGVGYPNYSGVEVSENSALGLSAVYRAVALISGTVAQLPLRTLRDTGDGQRQRVGSFLDNPGGPHGPTSFEWTETVLLHLLLHGNAFLMHVYGGAGQLVALVPIHPLCVSVEWAPERPGGKLFKTNLYAPDGTTTLREFDATTMTQIMGMSLDGLRGLSPVAVARNSLGTAIAGDRAAARMFSNGALTAGLVSADGEELDPDEAKIVKETIDRKVTGWENAGSIAFVNRKLKFTPWTMSAEDAQFLQSRAFQIEEVARWFGIPPFALMQTEKQTSWGTGIEAQQQGLGRTVLAPWAARIEQRLSRLLPNPRFVEFDFSGLERPTPEEEINLLLSQVDGGLITINEARAVRNLPPVEGGAVLRLKGQPVASPTPTPADQAATGAAPAAEEVPA